MADIIDVRELNTTEDLFRELSPATGSIWRHNDHIGLGRDWIFRGQANGRDGAVWGLKPSAHRQRDAFLPFVLAQVAPRDLSGAELRAEEMRHVMTFAGRVDFHGLIVPSDTHELRDPRIPHIERSADATMFPPPPLVAMFALAQHHGIPTRLLDWTWKPHVAAYFAAIEVAQRRPPGTMPPATEAPHFSIYALQHFAFEATRGRDPEIHWLTVPTATNANLHAQGGQFTLVQPVTDPGDAPLPAVDEVLRKHEDDLVAQYGRARFPLLVEFRIPVREARTTLLTLWAMGVNAASIFPGLDGVARALREKRLHQRAALKDRS